MQKIVIDPSNIDHSLIKEAAQIISKGALVALPTETVYGIGCRVGKKSTLDRLYEVKKRSKDKPLSFALGDSDMAVSNYFDTLMPFAYRLIEKFWPGPLTIIYYTPKNKKIGIRIPSHIVTSEILRTLNAAIYFSSANTSGKKEAVSAAEVESMFDGKIDLIVDGGSCTYSKASTVVDLTCKPLKVLREGAVSEGDIVKTFVRKRILFVCTGNSCRSPMAQFLLEKYLKLMRPHYSDRYEVISRGISAFSGSAAAPSAISILKDNEGIDASGFTSKKMDRYAVLSSDYIFTMEDAQTEYILKMEPSLQGRVFNVKKFISPEPARDIPDPIGGNITHYEEVYSLLKEAILELIDWI